MGQTGTNWFMQITWIYNQVTYCADVEASIQPFVRALGSDLAARLFLMLGGSEIYIRSSEITDISDFTKSKKTLLYSAVGSNGIQKLKDEFGGNSRRIPLGRNYLVRTLYCQNHSVADISRTIRCANTTVQKILKTGKVVEDVG